MFTTNELKEGTCHLVDFDVGVQDVFAIMWATPKLFKTLTNFNLVEFGGLVLLVAPTIVQHAQFTNEHHIQVLDLRFALKF